MAFKKPLSLVLFCDGTWASEATSEISTNVQILAKSFAYGLQPPPGGDLSSLPVASTGSAEGAYTYHLNENTNTRVCYFEGIGADVADSWWGYITGGAFAFEISKQCMEAYRFIVDTYEPGASIYMFGFSRGAYTVRSVAGMINNCGILKSTGLSPAALTTLTEKVYSMYRNKDEKGYAPAGDDAKRFRAEYSHRTTTPPIRFMGLIDTVGALGIPRIRFFEAPKYEFYDTKVSSEVQAVYQALATHDRMSFFEPCFIDRNFVSDDNVSNGNGNRNGNRRVHTHYNDVSNYITMQKWFPGAHYDVGRQEFKIGRLGNRTLLDRILRGISDRGSLLNAMYTELLADPPVEWLIQLVQQTDPALLPNGTPQDYVHFWRSSVLQADGQPVSGWKKDAYDAIVSLGDFSAVPYVGSLLNIIKWPLSTVTNVAAQNVIQILKDRVIPVNDSTPNFHDRDGWTEEQTMTQYPEDTVPVQDPPEHAMFRSRTYQTFLATQAPAQQLDDL